jgi:integrase
VTEKPVTKIAAAYREFREIECAANTLRGDKSALRVLQAMGVQYVSELTMPDANKYRAQRRAEGTSLCTINKEIEALKRMLDWAVANKMCEANPIATLKRHKDRGEKQRRAFKLEEIRDLIAHMPEKWRLLFQLFLCTGVRNAEARCLPWSEVDLDAGIIRLPEDRTKMRKEHIVLLGPRMVAKLRDVAPFGEYVFPNPETGQPYDATSLCRTMKRAAEKAGWSDMRKLSPQTLRVSFASLADEHGITLVDIGKLLGHKGNVTQECYIVKVDEKLRAEAVKIEALVLGDAK